VNRRILMRLAALLANADTVRLLGCMLLNKENDSAKEYYDLPDFLTWVPDEQKLAEGLISSRHEHLRCALNKTAEAIPLGVEPVERLYGEWESLLSLLGEGPGAVCKYYADTKYYRSKMIRLGRLKGKIKVAEYHALFRSMAEEGFVGGEGRPVIVLDGYRKSILIDGAHRSVLMRHMGYAEVMGYRYKASELLCSSLLSESERSAIQRI